MNTTMIKDYSATTGTALADEDQTIKAFAHAVVTPATRTPSPGTFATIALDRITPSLANPRKTFAPARMAELVDSIRASGVHQPILVRPLPGARVGETDRAVQYEIVAGERRYRASQMAGVPNIPTMIRALTDDQALEVMLVENVMRDDLAPLEEAEGYDHLMQHTGLSADEVAVTLGVDTGAIVAEARATVKAEVNEEIKTLKAQIAPKPKAAQATTPAAGVDVSSGGKGAKAKKLEAPLRKPKTSASEAQAQIAAAMQAEEKTDPGADAQGIEAASGFALAVGARVKVLPSAETGGPAVRKWIGKTGTIKHQVGPEAWDVMFTDKVANPVTGKAVAEFQSFHVTELEVVE